MEHVSALSLGSAAESPVRSSGLLGGAYEPSTRLPLDCGDELNITLMGIMAHFIQSHWRNGGRFGHMYWMGEGMCHDWRFEQNTDQSPTNRSAAPDLPQ
jgi:hypothetical protein